MPGLLLSALLLVLAYPPYDIGFLGLVALIPWLRSLETVVEGGGPVRRAWRSGWMLGFLFFGGTMWWLGYVTITGAVVLTAYLALYPAAFGTFVIWTLRRRAAEGLALAALLASGWTLLEWLRSTLFTGLGWNLLAHTQWRGPFLQLADLVGVYGVSWLVAFLNAALWLSWRKGARRRVAVAAALLVVLAVGYAAARRAAVERAVAAHPVLSVAVVQGNIPLEQSWDSQYVAKIASRYEELTRQAAAGGAKLIIWPETSVPGLASDPEWRDWLTERSDEAGAPLVVGAPWLEEHPGPRLFNSALLVRPVMGVVERYDKLHLVPFGEFLPGEQWWPALGRVRERLPIGEFTPGTHPTVFQLPTDPPVEAGVLICFEDVFPAISRTMVRRGARMLATITNDAWFGRTAAPIQHTQASVFRAVEHRVWMLRAANTGYSCVIDPFGRVVAAVHDAAGRTIDIPGFQVVPVPVASAAPTVYTRLGDWWLLVCGIFLALAIHRRTGLGKRDWSLRSLRGYLKGMPVGPIREEEDRR